MLPLGWKTEIHKCRSLGWLWEIPVQAGHRTETSCVLICSGLIQRVWRRVEVFCILYEANIETEYYIYTLHHPDLGKLFNMWCRVSILLQSATLWYSDCAFFRVFGADQADSSKRHYGGSVWSAACRLFPASLVFHQQSSFGIDADDIIQSRWQIVCLHPSQ